MVLTGFWFQIEKFHGRFQYMFIESICNDSTVLEQNCAYKMMYSPDYQGVGTDEVMQYPDHNGCGPKFSCMEEVTPA